MGIADISDWDEYDDDDPREDDCDHDDYEADILTGIATCWRCGHRWMQTADEIAAEHERIRRYQEYEDRENSRERRREIARRVREWFRSLMPARRRSVPDDEIPF